jgi:site-specific DNA-methyltransferase (adenine-specific)
MLDFGYYNMDCMDGMKEFPDKYFDIAVVDPPYFSGPEKRGFYGRRISPIGVQRVYQKSAEWIIPDKAYFDELFRVSKNQIVWGCNYFDYHFPPGRIVWDKCNGNTDFSDCEIAFCSFHDSVRLFRYMWNGMFQGKSIQEGHIQQGNKKKNEKRIHPTQKPVMLYRWLFDRYTERGMKLLDTHVGSASSLITAHDAGLQYVGFELDKHYYELSKKRLEEHTAQMSLSDFPEVMPK